MIIHANVDFQILRIKEDKTTAKILFMLRRRMRLHVAVIEAGIKKFGNADTASITSIVHIL